MKPALTFRWLLALLLAAAVPGAPARAGETSPVPLETADQPPADLVWQTGLIGIFDREARDTFASLEARLRWNWHGIRPWTGLTIVDNGAWFSGTGLIYDIDISSSGRLTLGSGPFYYNHGKKGDDLGLSLEFYSFIEASWVTKHDVRLGVRLGHLSNAGLSRRNPGTETLGFVMSVPLERRKGSRAID
jgi:hypothetical protein